MRMRPKTIMMMKQKKKKGITMSKLKDWIRDRTVSRRQKCAENWRMKNLRSLKERKKRYGEWVDLFWKQVKEFGCETNDNE